MKRVQKTYRLGLHAYSSVCPIPCPLLVPPSDIKGLDRPLLATESDINNTTIPHSGWCDDIACILRFKLDLYFVIGLQPKNGDLAYF